MSERRDGDWIAARAAACGIELDEGRASEIAAEVAPIFARFGTLVGDLGADDDPGAFSRRLAAEAGG